MDIHDFLFADALKINQYLFDDEVLAILHDDGVSSEFVVIIEVVGLFAFLVLQLNNERILVGR